MTMMTVLFVLSVLFLAIFGYGIWNDLEEMRKMEQQWAEIEQRKAEREARKWSVANMQAVWAHYNWDAMMCCVLKAAEDIELES